MRHRYVWDPKLNKLVYKGIIRGPNYNGTAQVGDIPDLIKDAENTKRIRDEAYRQQRKEDIIQAVDSVSQKPEEQTYQRYMERELRNE